MAEVQLVKTFWGICAVVGGLTAGASLFAGQLITIKDSIYDLFDDFNTGISLSVGDTVHFRPRTKPPSNPSEIDAPQDWIESPVTITMRINYSHLAPRGARAQVEREEMLFEIGNYTTRYLWYYKVNFLSDVPCEDWLCVRDIAKAENIEPGRVSESREMMFFPSDTVSMTWKEFIDQVVASDGPEKLAITIQSFVRLAKGFRTKPILLRQQCRVDVAAYRNEFWKKKFVSGHDPRPVFWEPVCQNSALDHAR